MSAQPSPDDPKRSPTGEEAAPPLHTPSGPLYQPGDIIAQKYRLTRVIGAGGMGAVWLARNEKLDVDVAIKLIRHELGTAEAAHRLLQEARAAARIEHRSIVRVFDFGETELDDPFIVMEVLTGESLREVLERKGRLPAANAVRTLLPIASALVEAHESGIVHRDLKPENIMLVPDKSGGALPKLLDFGIAKFIRAEGSADDSGRTRMAVGTPDYMAPEQAGGHDEVGEAADVWALAVILYEAITGRVPFAGPNYAALIFAIMTAEPAATHEQMAGDAELWNMLQACLSKRDVDRPTMRALGTSLAEWAIARGIDSDIAGTSLAAHWLNDPTHSPFSELPPPVAEPAAIPRPAGVPAGLRGASLLAPTEAPPADDLAPSVPVPAARRGGALWIAVAMVFGAAVAVLFLRGRFAANPPPVPAAVTVVEPRAATPPPGSASPVLPASAVEPPASAIPAPPGSVAEPAPGTTGGDPVASAPGDAPSSRVVPARAVGSAKQPAKGAKTPPRRGGLPIAKQPNF